MLHINRAAKATILSFLCLTATLGYITQASYLLEPHRAALWRGSTVIPALSITLAIGAVLPARRLVTALTAVATAFAAIGFGDPDLKSWWAYFGANVLTDLTVSITWKLCGQNFQDPVRGQSVQNVLSLIAVGAAGALAARLSPFGVRPYAALALFTALAAIAVGLSGRVRPSLFPDEEIPEQPALPNNGPAWLWTVGLSSIFALVLALRATAEIPSFDIVKRVAHVGDAFMMVEPGLGIAAALLFTIRPSLYHALVRIFRGEGRLIVSMALIASATYVLTGVSAQASRATCVYAAWGVTGAALEILERTCDNVIYEYSKGRRREVFASMFVSSLSRLFMPLVLTPLAYFNVNGAETLMMQGGLLTGVLFVVLVAAKPIGRLLIKVAGPQQE